MSNMLRKIILGFAVAASIAAPAIAEGTLDVRPVLELAFDADLNAVGMSDAMGRVFIVPQDGVQTEEARHEVLRADPMYWDVRASFEGLQDPDQPETSGFIACVRIGRVTRDAITHEDPDSFGRDMLMQEAFIGPEALARWPNRAVASVFCNLAVIGPDPIPSFDADLAVDWLVERMDQVDGTDPAVFTSGDMMASHIEASGVWEESGVMLASVSVVQIDNVLRMVNLRAYILGGES